MTYVGEFISLSDRPAWEEALAGIVHSFGHTWQSCQAMQLTTGWRTHLYYYAAGETRFVCPIAEREFRGQIDIVTPYGFSGFAGFGDVLLLLDAWNSFARQRGYVCGYIALNPLLVGPEFAEAEGLTFANELYFLDLSRSEEALIEEMSRNRRRPIRRWQQAGSPLITDRAILTEFFMRQFAPFMQSRGASGAYRFADETLLHLIHEPRSIILGAATEGQLDAVALFCHSETIGEAMFSLSTPEGGSRHADVLMWAGATELKRRNVLWLSMGGGISRNDGVAALKRGYGGLAMRMPVLRQIYERTCFEYLCNSAGVDPTSQSGYFPPYHKVPPHVR